MMRAKRLGRGSTGDSLQNRRLHFHEAVFLEKTPGLANNRDTFFEHGPGTLVGEKIEITLPVARLNVLQAMPLFGKRPQSLRHKAESACLQRRFAALGEETGALDANEITDIEQTKKIDQIRANFLGVNINLNAPSGVAKIEEVALAHVPVRGDAASRAQNLALREFFAHLRDCSVRFERSAERLDTLRTQRVEFFSAQRDQFILFIHRWHSLPGYRRISISQAGCLCHKEMNSLNKRLAEASV